MKHIKLFEAFKSQLLSKTLRYLSKKSKILFLNKVKSICDEIDFPYSELKDEYFEYLTFNKAFDKVEGNDKIYKFWLDTNANLINISLTDGVALKSRTGYTEDKEYIYFSELRDDFRSGLINHLDKIFINFDEFDDDVKTRATLYIEPNGDRVSMYAIYSDEDCYLEGSEPDNEDWTDWGNRSWSLVDNDWTIWSLKPENNGEELWNKKIDSNDAFTKKSLSESQFAIVFNTSKLDTSKKRTEIKSGREEMRSGATALLSNEEIRKTNFNNRILKMANTDNFNSLFDKVLFNKWIMFDISNSALDLDKLIKIKEDKNIEEEEERPNFYMDKLRKWYLTLNGDSKTEVTKYFSSQTDRISNEIGDHKSSDNVRDLAAKLTLINFNQISTNLDTDLKAKLIFEIIQRLHTKKSNFDSLTKEMNSELGKEVLNKIFQLGELVTKKIKPNIIEDLDDLFVIRKRMNMILDVVKEVGYLDQIKTLKDILTDSTPPNDDELKFFNENIDKTIRIINKL